MHMPCHAMLCKVVTEQGLLAAVSELSDAKHHWHAEKSSATFPVAKLCLTDRYYHGSRQPSILPGFSQNNAEGAVGSFLSMTA